ASYSTITHRLPGHCPGASPHVSLIGCARPARSWAAHGLPDCALASISVADLSRDYAPIVACDNIDGATDIYGARLTGGPRPAVVVGNERHGLARDMQAIAGQAVQIPMASRTLNCLNVAAASA